MKPHVYIMSPYTQGDPGINVRQQIKIFSVLMEDARVIPYAPLVSHFIHIMYPRSYEEWLQYDLAMIERMDIGLRIAASYKPLKYNLFNSAGANREEAHFNELNKPVVYSIFDLYNWIDKEWKNG